MAKKDRVFKEIRRIAKANDCDENFLNQFDACYSFMYDTINDLSVEKQVLITVKCMSLGVKSQTNMLRGFFGFRTKQKLNQ